MIDAETVQNLEELRSTNHIDDQGYVDVVNGVMNVNQAQCRTGERKARAKGIYREPDNLCAICGADISSGKYDSPDGLVCWVCEDAKGDDE